MKILLIDGENTRKMLENVLVKPEDFLKISPVKILQKTIQDLEFDRVIWFNAKIKFDETNSNKSNDLINFQRKLFRNLLNQNIEINLEGKIQKFDDVFKEKGVDVAIATEILSAAYENINVEIFVWSSDSDLVPAIKRAKEKGAKIKYITLENKITQSIHFHSSYTFILRKEVILEVIKNIQSKTPSEA